MVHTMLGSSRGYKWTIGTCDNEGVNTLDAMVQFVAAGMRAPTGDEATARKPQVHEISIP